MRKKLLADFSMNELQEIYNECGTQRKMAERLDVSQATISKMLGKRRVGGGKPKVWSIKSEPMTTPISETAKVVVVQAPVIQPAVSFDQMEVNVKGKAFSYTIMHDHIEIWGGHNGIELMYDEIDQFYKELSDALRVADRLHGVLEPYKVVVDKDAGADQP